MSNRVPIIYQVSRRQAWPLYVLLFAVFLTLFRSLPPAHLPYGVLAATAGMLLYIFLSRAVLTRSHRRGIRLVKAKQFDAALPHFAASVAFFEQNGWIDRWRSVVLLSMSAMSYREMGLCNMAFCHSQARRGPEAKALYEQILAEYPENGIAEASLNMMRSVGGESS